MTSDAATSLNYTAVPDQAEPTVDAGRIDGLDVLRGFAVLMIFVVNIKMMANGYNHYGDRTLWEGEYDQIIGYLHNVLVHGKFVTIFTALFGAGLALLLAREKPVPRSVVLKRLFWLTVFGAIHLVFIREGDILMQYALVGFIVIAFVKMKGSALLALGLAIQVALFFASVLSPVEYTNIPILWQDGPEMHIEVERIMLGTFTDQVSARIDTMRFYLIDLFIGGRGWIDKVSVMIMGMGLLKTGFLTGQLSATRYFLIGLAGFVSASFLIVFRLIGGADWSFADTALNGLWTLHRFGGAIAWSALAIGLTSVGWKAKAMAAAGRTAFTIYILQSVIGLALFSSLGLGLFGQLTLGELTFVTAITLAAFLIAAPIWLTYFRFGPLEWLWRTLTYGEAQRMRRLQTS